MLGKSIKLLQVLSHSNVASFARALTVSPRYLFMVLGGTRTPSQKLLNKIAASCNVQLDWLRTGLGWMVTPSDPHAWLSPILRLAAVQRVVIVRSDQGPEGVLIETPDGVMSVRIGPPPDNIEPTQSHQSYVALLHTFKSWGGPVGRVAVQAWQQQRLQQIDLATLLKDATFTSWIAEDELARLTAEIRRILQQIDRELHEVIAYTAAPDFDPLMAAELMGRVGRSYQTLGYHRFTGLLVSMEDLRQASSDESEETTLGPQPAPLQRGDSAA